MAEASGPRFFTIEVADAKYAAGPSKGKRIENVGRYSSSNPLSAGRKAATRLYGEAKLDSVVFILRETTRGSGNPHFVYSGEKKKLAAPVSYTRKSRLPDGTVKEDTITKTHENQVRAIRGENELRALYKKLDIPFPADIVDDSKKRSSKAKSASRKVGGGARRPHKKRGGGDLADTAAPVENPAEAGDASVEQEGGTASSQCCQAAPADQAHLISTGGQISAHAAELEKANQMSEAAKQAANEARAALEAERARILSTM